MSSNEQEKEIRYLKGIGPRRAEAFNGLGIFNVRDFLEYFPRTYEDRSVVKKIKETDDGDSVTLCATVETIDFRRVRKNLSILKLVVSDETGHMNIVWFNQDYLIKNFREGEKYWFFGRVYKKILPEMNNPVYAVDFDAISGIVPIYSTNSFLSQNVLRKSIKAALELAGNSLQEFMPGKILAQQKLAGYREAVENIHFPESNEMFAKARRRLVFQEFFLLQASLLLIKDRIAENAPVKRRNYDFSAGNHYIENLEFELTDAQKRVIGEIRQDFTSGKPMNRLVQGDVGSGKTAVAATAIADICKNGFQAAFMAPTEILATQHYVSLAKPMGELGVKMVLLTGSIKSKERKEMLEKLESGEISCVVGTHALIQSDVEFKSLGLVITDEQHRFGVEQRTVLCGKGDIPHSMVLTATPIPRTLALILYGDLDVSLIDEMPPGRKPVETYSVGEGKRIRVLDFAGKRMREGRQVYYVCPRIEDTGEPDGLISVEEAFDDLKKRYEGFRVAMMHGKLENSKKESIMGAFYRGEVDLLVSTTVIEVGVNVPNATLMIIENAERFGLAQLHQLRGRVGRGQEKSYCIMIVRGHNPVAGRRMKIMEETNDGFIISEEDLRLRGPGEFFGTRQHGIPEFRIANIYTDMDILKEAQKTAIEFIGDGLELHNTENTNIIKKIEENISRFGNI